MPKPNTTVAELYCQDAQPVLDGILALFRTAGFQEHVVACAACRAALSFFAEIAVQNPTRPLDLDDAARERVESNPTDENRIPRTNGFVSAVHC